MIADLEKRLDAVCDSMESAENEFKQATQCLVEALEGIHQRMERIEKWIENQERVNQNR
jgi:hypothetical protein